LTGLALLATLGVAGGANAELRSTRGPFYIQGALPALNVWGGSGLAGCGRFGGCSSGGWRPDVEFGIHFTGRHDGFVLAFRQAFIVTAPSGDPGGATVVKLGYDIPIQIKKYELDIGPYGTFGVGYDFGGGGRIGVQAGFVGVDVKFFIVKGFYAFARPFEFGMQCFHDFGGRCGFQYVMGLGVGYAFPN
jgi:hypothetical protein